MIELVRDLRAINVLAKFENDPSKIMDVRVLTGLVCPAARPPARPPARPLGVRQYPGALKGCGVKNNRASLLYYLSFLHYFVAIGVFKLELQSGNA